MPHSSSAKKRLRQNEKRRLRNKAVKSNVRTAIKRFRAAVAAGNVDQAAAEMPSIHRKLDQAVAKGVLHANTAGRYKARLAALVAKSTAPTA